MMGAGVFEYAAINARVRAVYAGLLTAQTWADLANAPDYAALVSLLRRTLYGPSLMAVEEGQLTPRRLVYQIKRQMAGAFATLLKSTPEQACPLLTQYYREYEVNNLKAVLRGLRSGAPWTQVRYVLFPLDSFSSIPAEAMLGSSSIGAAIDLLKGTPYFPTLSHALTRFNLEQSLFPFEVALDLSYWREIWDTINQLKGEDRNQAMRIAGSLLDMNNLMWAIRYRVYYNLSEEEIINYTLPFGHKVKDADIRAIASGADIAQVVLRIYPHLEDVTDLLLKPRSGLPGLEIMLQRQALEQCRKAFIGYPFHIGVPLAFLVLKKMEIQDLTALIEAKSSGVPLEGFHSYLVGSVAAR